VVLFNYSIREITAKIVYYGPGLCGKTTNLQFIHGMLDPGARGKLLSLATDGDRTLFFDFLPIEMGSISGYKVRFQLYTVPGQVHYNATRKLVLKGVDAVVFVADSQLSMVERNRESFENLVENLAENGYELARIPIVIQLNKRDLPNVASPAELVAAMAVDGYPVLEAVASRGDGVFETLKTVVKLTLGRLRSQFETEPGASDGRREATEPPPPPPPPAEVFAPSLPPPAPPPPEVAAPVPAVAAPPSGAEPPAPAAAESAPEPAEEWFETGALADDGLEEFDLEGFQEEGSPAGPAGEEGSFAAGFGGQVPLDRAQEFEMFTAGDEGGEGFGLETLAGQPAEEGAPFWAAPEAGQGAAAGPAEPPAWAVAMQGELKSLREENRALRSALQAFAGVLDQQIAALEAGREEIRRAAAEAEPPAAEEKER
jgi:hypothetical protein